MYLNLLSSFVRISTHEKGIFSKISRDKYKSKSDIKTIVFKVLITKDHKILINDNSVELKDLKKRTKKFLLEESDKEYINLQILGKQKRTLGIISLGNEKDANYEFYKSVYDELQTTYEEIREDYSINYFQTNYKNLSEEEKKEIGQMIPYMLSESEPINLDDK